MKKFSFLELLFWFTVGLAALFVFVGVANAAPFPSITVTGTYGQVSIWEMTGDDGPQTGGAQRRFQHHWKRGTAEVYVNASGIVIRKGVGGVDANAESSAVFVARQQTTAIGVVEQSPGIGYWVNGGPQDMYLLPGESWFVEVYTDTNYYPPAVESSYAGKQTVLIKYSDAQYGGPIEMRSFPHTFTNLKDYPVKWVLMDKDDNILAQATVQPGATATFTSVSSAPNTLASQGPFVAKVFVPANLSDGGWVEADLADGDEFTISPAPTGVSYNAGETPPLTPVANYGVPEGTPTQGPQNPSEKPVWSTEGDEGALSNGVYKQGVEKQLGELTEIKDLLSGDGMIDEPGTAGFSATSNNTFTGNGTVSDVLVKLGNWMPSVPSHLFPNVTTKSPTYALTFPMSWANQTDIPFELDVGPYDTAVQFCRGAALCGLALLTWFLIMKLIRGAFVDQ